MAHRFIRYTAAAALAAAALAGGCSNAPRSGMESEISFGLTPTPEVKWSLKILPAIDASTPAGWTLPAAAADPSTAPGLTAR